MADERSVDVDEPTNPTPAAGSVQPVVGVARLTPVQEAYRRYAVHFLNCPDCMDRSGPSCETAPLLWRAYQEQVEVVRAKLLGR